MRSRLIWVAALTLTTACEDGPSQIFEPNEGNPPAQNGYGDQTPFTPSGTKGYDVESTGDAVGRARYCNEVEQTDLVQRMVVAPILPNEGAGLLPLWASDGSPLLADVLPGRPEEGKFCDPDEYANAYVWGPMYEIILFFNEETRLVEGLQTSDAYLGKLEGDYTIEGTTDKRHIVMKNRDWVVMNKGTAGEEKRLKDYASRAEQASKPNSFLNYDNVNLMYRMVRETFFDVPATALAGLDCIAEQICDIIYTGTNEAVKQDTLIAFWDSGVILYFYPSGNLGAIIIEPVRIATFENAATIDFDTDNNGTIDFGYTSNSLAGCHVELDPAAPVDFATFKSRCIEDSTLPKPPMLARANYTPHTMRDAVDVEFNGVTLSFGRKTSTDTVIRDGEWPKDTDVLFAVNFTRSLFGNVAEFVPANLGVDYLAALKPLLYAAVSTGCGGPGDNPFCTFVDDLDVPPDLVATSRRIGELMYDAGGGNMKSWIPDLFVQIAEAYYSLDPSPFDDRSEVDPIVLDQIYLIRPFLEVVLNTLTHGASASAPFTVHGSQDDRRFAWINTSFKLSDQTPMRVEVQYSMNYGAVTSVSVSQGYSEVDTIFGNLTADINATKASVVPYYELSMSGNPGVNTTPNPYVNPYALGNAGILLVGDDPFDRQLNMLTVSLATRSPTEADGTLSPFKAYGSYIEDLGGYYRQTGGERFEWVPASLVYLWGRETMVNFAIEADGTIGRVGQTMFKGTVELCDGLPIAYGDDVRLQVERWQAIHTPDEFANCNVVFNYSLNGNVLDGVASLNKRVSVAVLDGRAYSASMWR